jgi:hypothetical protein
MTTPHATDVWTAKQIHRLGVTTDLATAASILGINRSQAYQLAATNTFPAPLIRAGSRIIVPLAGLRRLLLIVDTDASEPPLDPGPESSVHTTTASPADCTRRRWRHHTEHPGDHP